MNKIATALIEQRLALGLTQAAVAKSAGVARKTVSGFENNYTSITVDNLGRLLRAVGLELAVRPATPRPTLSELQDTYPDEESDEGPKPKARRVRKRKAP